MADPTKIAAGLAALTEVCSDTKVQKMIFGTYSDGKPRSVFDAINGEILSPQQKKQKLYKKKKSGKKKLKL